jgi:hypothetical protein
MEKFRRQETAAKKERGKVSMSVWSHFTDHLSLFLFQEERPTWSAITPPGLISVVKRN